MRRGTMLAMTAGVGVRGSAGDNCGHVGSKQELVYGDNAGDDCERSGS